VEKDKEASERGNLKIVSPRDFICNSIPPCVDCDIKFISLNSFQIYQGAKLLKEDPCMFLLFVSFHCLTHSLSCHSLPFIASFTPFLVIHSLSLPHSLPFIASLTPFLVIHTLSPFPLPFLFISPSLSPLPLHSPFV